MISRANTARARLCGRRDRRARSRARLMALGASVSFSWSAMISTGSRGTCWRSRTAAATTLAMASRPLISAVCGGSAPAALTPGNRSPTVDSSTLVSPRDGRTWPM